MSLRLAAIVFLLPLAGQPAAPRQSNQHGLSVGTGSVYLFGAPENAAGQTACDGPRIRESTAGVFAQFDTWIVGLSGDFQESVHGDCAVTTESASSVTLRRFVRDNFRMLYIRYAITVEALPEAGSYRVTFHNSDAPLPKDVDGRQEWKVSAPAQYPVPQVMQDGDEIPLHLATSDRGVQIVDYIRVGALGKMPKREEAARDSYAEDAEFTLAKPGLRLNGLARESVAFPEALRGRVLWLYVPGEGRYVVTFGPHPEFGFEKLGEVSGNLMTLVVSGNVVRIESLDRIAPGGGAYNVYGAKDGGWEPADVKERERFLAGTSPGEETALGR